MMRKTLAFLMVLSAASSLEAKTRPIGSVVAHGELRVDGYAVKGSGTAFDGTAIETGSDARSDADLLLSNGTRITLHSNSRGILFRDHFVLDRGEAEMSAPAPYRVEVDGLMVRSIGPNSSERIVIGSDHAIGIFAKEGRLEVAGSRVSVLAVIEPQNSRSFSRDANGHWNVSDASAQGFNEPGRGNNGEGIDRNRGHHHPHPSH